MQLFNEIATPIELTGVARAAIGDYEQTRPSLASVLPNITVPTRTVRYNTRGTGNAEAATFRSWDAEAAIGLSDQAGQDVTAELPPVSQKIRVSELDLVDASVSTASDAKRNIVANQTIRVARAISDAVEWARGQVLDGGKITFNERGLKMVVDFDRPDEFNATAAALWSDPSADAFSHLMAANDTFVEANGEAATKMVMSRTAVSALLRNASILALIGTPERPAPSASLDQLNGAFVSYGLPQIVLYDRKVNRGNGSVPVIDPTKVILTADEAGKTVFGPTAEANEPNYGIAAEDRPGVVVGAYKSDDPVAVWVKAAASALPLLSSGTSALALKVL